MMLIFRSLISLIILLISSHVFACFPAKITLEERFTLSTQIFIGQVKGKSIIQNENASLSSLSTISSPVTPYQLEVIVTEVLKGHSDQKTIYPQIINCGSGKASVNDKVIIFYDGQYWYSSIFQSEVYQQIKSF